MKYPYYIATGFDAGILVKFRFGTRDGKKFKNYEDTIKAVHNFLKNHPTYDKQICIIEYTDQYQANIKCIINTSEELNIMHYEKRDS